MMWDEVSQDGSTLQQVSIGHDWNYDNMWHFCGQANTLAFSPSPPNYSGSTNLTVNHTKRGGDRVGKPSDTTNFPMSGAPSNASCSECHRLSQERASSSPSLNRAENQPALPLLHISEVEWGLINLYYHKTSFDTSCCAKMHERLLKLKGGTKKALVKALNRG